MTQEFDNKNRNRYYGIRVGDTVKLKFSHQNPEPIAEVSRYAWGDNNRVYVKLEDGTETNWVAEWCEVLIKVEVKDRLKEIEAEVEKLDAILEEKEKIWWENKKDQTEFVDDYKEYCKMREPEVKRLCELDREERMIMPYELKDLPDYGDVMPLKDFIDCVKSGGFIDYDGSGNYVKDGKKTNIMIHPSDVHYNTIRKEFDTIIWFNR